MLATDAFAKIIDVKKIVEQKNYKKENRCNIPHTSEITFFFMCIIPSFIGGRKEIQIDL